MPLLPIGIQATLTPSLLATGMLGVSTPTFALGVGIGVSTWLKSVPVSTIDSGSLGVGSGQLPLVVPQPLLLANIMASFVSMGVIGPMSMLKAVGLATGLSLAFPTGIIKTTHPGIGVGTGVAKFGPVPAAPFIIAGLAQVAMTGPGVVQVATAIGLGINLTFTALVLPIPIVGAGSPAGGAGVGYGMVI